MKSISGQLREMRLSRGLSLHAAARRTGTSPATLSRYENGWTRFEVYTLNKIASALGYRLRISFEALPNAGEALASAAVVRRLKRLFWDRPLKARHLNRNPAWVIERVLDYGALADVRMLMAFLGREKFLRTVAGIHFKSARTRAFWQAILDQEHIPCTPKPFRQGAVNSWPG